MFRLFERLHMDKIINGKKGVYRVGKRLGGTVSYTLYQCQQEGTGVELILKIAKDTAKNGLLDREAFLLKDMYGQAEKLEADFAKASKGPTLLNYQLCFPAMIESFIVQDQGRRRVTVLGFNGIENLKTLVPISHITSRNHVRVDPKTSAWIMGKLLKALVFAHDQGIAVGYLTGDNILVEGRQHYVTLFDWTRATRYESGVPLKLASEEISLAAKEVVTALGGNPVTGTLPENDQLTDGRYATFLQRLASGEYSDAGDAHSDFYTLIRELWPHRAFYPFTTLPLI